MCLANVRLKELPEICKCWAVAVVTASNYDNGSKNSKLVYISAVLDD